MNFMLRFVGLSVANSADDAVSSAYIVPRCPWRGVHAYCTQHASLPACYCRYNEMMLPSHTQLAQEEHHQVVQVLCPRLQPSLLIPKLWLSKVIQSKIRETNIIGMEYRDILYTIISVEVYLFIFCLFVYLFIHFQSFES